MTLGALALVLAVIATAVHERGRAGAQAAFSCGIIPQSIVVSAVMPRNFSAGNGQAGADCMAWQQFIYVNWPADPKNPGEPDPTKTSPSDFGVPNNYTTVWESYPEASTLFQPGSTLHGLLAATRRGVKSLHVTSKFANDVLDLHGISQAGNNAWLTDQAGGLTYYEVRVNKDEAQYVTTNKLQTASGQLACTQGAKGFNLPSGSGTDYTCTGTTATYGDNFGALEVKAAWVELTDPSKYSQFLVANATIQPPTGPAHNGVVGLVGLHIIHKVPNAQQFIWATFEHVANDPQTPPPAGTPAYTYYNPGCNPKTDYYQCEINHQPKPGDPYSAPVQVARINAIGTMQAAPATMYVWSLLPANSVFRNYELVDTLWPQGNTPIAPGATTPLTYGNSKSEVQPLANTTLETYFQGPLTPLACLDCHTSAPINTGSSALRLVRGATGKPAKLLILPAPHSRTQAGATPASDYSFIFFNNGQ